MITEKMLDLLRIKVKSYVNERTYSHILGVEREAASLADIYLPEGERNKARAAALLHDITKNETVEKQLQSIRFRRSFIIQRRRRCLSKETFPSLLIRRSFRLCGGILREEII